MKTLTAFAFVLIDASIQKDDMLMLSIATALATLNLACFPTGKDNDNGR